jgi:hypothetical protein
MTFVGGPAAPKGQIIKKKLYIYLAWRWLQPPQTNPWGWIGHPQVPNKFFFVFFYLILDIYFFDLALRGG